MTKTHTVQFNFRIDPEVKQALDIIRERDGVTPSEQVRRAIVAWIAERGVAMSSKYSKYQKYQKGRR